MSVQVVKTGIINASGEIGANICPNTTYLERQYTYPSTSYSDRFSATTTIIPSSTTYVLSFWAKSTVSGDIVRAHYYYPNTTTTCENSQGVVKTASDGCIDVTLSDTWQFYWIRYTQTETTAVKHLIFPRMFSQERAEAAKGTGTVSVKCLKFEEGAIPTVWVPCTTNTEYVGDTCGFNEFNAAIAQITNGYVNAPDFIEI